MSQMPYRLVTYILLTILSLFAVATIIAGIFQCTPIHKAWNKTQSGNCYKLSTAWYANALFSVATDIAIVVLPMQMGYRLKTDRREKVLLFGLFGLGGFITVPPHLPLTFSHGIVPLADILADNIDSGYWSITDINVGVICISLPPLHACPFRLCAFFTGFYTRTNASSGPHHKSYSKSSSEPAAVGTHTKTQKSQKKRSFLSRQSAGSDFDLVFFTSDHNLKEGGIMKMPEIAVTGESRAEDAKRHLTAPCESQIHAV
ncbi:uncharacterized protein L3040_006817 [Drepanopeziza brunnea f. sp. 'multigermtubi']|nr:hypothetical protein L3040_006817 [Drepanopeziza brunnea f. sp. 'multigermtubi']